MTTLDPLLGQAMQLEMLPVVDARRWAVQQADALTRSMEQIGHHALCEGDAQAANQLANVLEALGVLSISLIAYSRGRSPRLESRKPNTTILIDQ